MEKQEASFFFSSPLPPTRLQVHDLTKSYFPHHLHSHKSAEQQKHARTHTHACTAKELRCAESTSGYGPRMLKDAFASTPVCAQEVLCVRFECVCALWANENILSCFTSNGPAETCVSCLKVPGCCLCVFAAELLSPRRCVAVERNERHQVYIY